MKESPFLKTFLGIAKEQFGDERVSNKANLFYQITLNENCKPTVDFEDPKRGNSAFQTDLCIFHEKDTNRPMVVIEFKTKITTHDILTYSNKAGKHKKIYPALRYGLLVSDMSSIPKRFFLHNENLDFFYCAKDFKDDNEKMRSFVKVLINRVNYK